MRTTIDSNYNPFSLTGKTILVTGASSGIGQQTAVECSKMGARLIITGRDESRLQATFDLLKGNDNLQFIAELTSPEDVNNLVSSMPELDGVVLCAGTGITKPFQFSKRDQYDKVFNVNYFAPVELLRLLVKKKILLKEYL